MHTRVPLRRRRQIRDGNPTWDITPSEHNYSWYEINGNERMWRRDAKRGLSLVYLKAERKARFPPLRSRWSIALTLTSANINNDSRCKCTFERLKAVRVLVSTDLWAAEDPETCNQAEAEGAVYILFSCCSSQPIRSGHTCCFALKFKRGDVIGQYVLVDEASRFL